MYGNTTGKCVVCSNATVAKEAGSSICTRCKDNSKIPNADKTACEATPWMTASDCDDAQYLNDSNIDRNQHSCVPCPRGASCKLNVAWRGVTAKYGWWRLHVATDPTRPPDCLLNSDPSNGAPPCAFAACLNPHACHGAMNKGRFKNEALKDAALFDRNETCDWGNGYQIDTCGAD